MSCLVLWVVNFNGCQHLDVRKFVRLTAQSPPGRSGGGEKRIEMSDWDGYREAQKERRKERLPVRTEEILSLRDIGYTVEKKTDYQFRINGLIDVYPIHNRWHELSTNKRGGAKNLKDFIVKKLNPTK